MMVVKVLAVKTKESINTTSFTEHMTDAADDDEHC